MIALTATFEYSSWNIWQLLALYYPNERFHFVDLLLSQYIMGICNVCTNISNGLKIRKKVQPKMNNFSKKNEVARAMVQNNVNYCYLVVVDFFFNIPHFAIWSIDENVKWIIKSTSHNALSKKKLKLVAQQRTHIFKWCE